MAVQVYQAKLLRIMDESGPDPAPSRTDFALCDTKSTAQVISPVIANLVILQHHLWLNLTENKDADKTALLDSRLSLWLSWFRSGWLR